MLINSANADLIWNVQEADGPPKSGPSNGILAKAGRISTTTNQTMNQVNGSMKESGHSGGKTKTECRHSNKIGPCRQHGFNIYREAKGFLHIFNKTKSDSMTALVVEMLVLSQMDKVLFSFQSSITEHVIRSRLQRNGYSDYDMELYRLYMQRFQDVLGVNMKGLVLRDSP